MGSEDRVAFLTISVGAVLIVIGILKSRIVLGTAPDPRTSLWLLVLPGGMTLERWDAWGEGGKVGVYRLLGLGGTSKKFLVGGTTECPLRRPAR